MIGIYNLNDYYDVKLELAGLDRIKHKQFKFKKLDLSERLEVSSLFENEQFDRVIHLAAQAGVRYSIENPHGYADSNLVGPLNILEGCR